MAETTPAPKKVERNAHLRWVPIAKMKINPLAQRDLNQAWVDRIAADFDVEQVGNPTVNLREGWFYLIDGHHRIEAMKQMGWGDQQIQCWTYENLTETDEAETFLKLNDKLTVDALAKFRVGVQAGRAIECDINRVVLAQGCCVSRDHVDGAIGAVGTLRRVYSRAGAGTLARTLRIARTAYGDAGLDAPIIDGLGLLCQRYNGALNDDEAIGKLSTIAGGVNGLLNKAELLRRQTGNQKGHCVAAAAVEIINRGRGGKKLPDWWK